MKFPSDRPYHECDNCGKEFSWKNLKPIRDLTGRLDAGGIVPTGECPDCGALCYPVVVKVEETLDSLQATRQRLVSDLNRALDAVFPNRSK